MEQQAYAVPAGDLRAFPVDVVSVTPDFVQDFHASQVGEPQFEFQPAADLVGERAALLEDGPGAVDLVVQQRAEGLGDPLVCQVVFGDAELFHVLLWKVDAAAGEVDGDVLPEVGQLQGGADGVGQTVLLCVVVAEEVEDEAADGHGRITAVGQEVVEGAVAWGGHVHPEGPQEVVQEVPGDPMAANGFGQGGKNRTPGGIETGPEAFSPFVEPPEAFGRFQTGFVGKVVGGSRKGVDAADVRAEGFGDQAGADGKVFVVGLCEGLAVGEGILDGDGNGRRGRLGHGIVEKVLSFIDICDEKIKQ